MLLRKTWRFGGDIADLAAAVRDGDADAALAVLGRGRRSVALVDPDDPGRRAATWSAGAAAGRGRAALAGDAARGAAPGWSSTGCCARTAPGRAGCRNGPGSIENWLAAEHDDCAARASGTRVGRCW